MGPGAFAANRNRSGGGERTTALGRVLAPNPPPFALLYRPRSTVGPTRLELLVGDAAPVDQLADLPFPAPDEARPSSADRHELLAVVPYRQVAERGFACQDDGEPILAMVVREQHQVSPDEALRRLPRVATALEDAHFDIDDEAYADIVRHVLDDEIGQGAGSNFVIKRSFRATIEDYSPLKALAIFRRLLLGEVGTYWTFIVHTGPRTFIGASPERHASLRDGVVVMNPISGTYRYPPSGLDIGDLMRFLRDRKEAEELYMVVDEELKMMAKVCGRGAQVVGPYLKEMGRLAHTEYLLRGRTSLDVRTILKETMFSPAVTGSPVENACRVIARHERHGRGYYSGVLALAGRARNGQPVLDSSILIRTAEIDRSGRLGIGVGATLVRLSDPLSEVDETRAKAAGIVAALGVAGGIGVGHQPSPTPGASGAEQPSVANHPEVRAALRLRNSVLAPYWLEAETARSHPVPQLVGRHVLVVDAEDTFTAMLAQQLRALGLEVSIYRYDTPLDLDAYDVVVVGPGPGDPRDVGDARISTLRRITRRLIDEEIPFLAVCLGHQVLATVLGLEMVRKQSPSQGLQQEIVLFGRRQVVGFYNTFAARSYEDWVHSPRLPGKVEVSRDRETGEVHALRGARFASVQFHPESILTQNGPEIVAELLRSIVSEAPRSEEDGAHHPVAVLMPPPVGRGGGWSARAERSVRAMR